MSRFHVKSALISRSSRHTGLLCALALAGVVGSATLTGCSSGSSTTTPTNGTTGTTGTTGNPAAGRGTINLTFSSPAGTNASTAAFQSSQATGALAAGAAGLNNLTVSGSAVAGSTIRVAMIEVLSSGTAVVGKSYPFTDSAGGDFGTLSYTEASTSGGTPSVWIAKGGNVIVDSISGKTYKLRVVDARMTTGEGNDSASTGSFTLNGTAEVTVP